MQLEYFIGRVHEQSVVPLPRPRVVVGVPTGVTEVEKRAVYDAVMASGARVAYLIEEPIAAALGAGLPGHVIEWCCQNGRHEFDFMRGDEETSIVLAG